MRSPTSTIYGAASLLSRAKDGVSNAGCCGISGKSSVAAPSRSSCTSYAVAAGVGDRRYVVYDVSAEHANDKSWFGPLYRDLDDGGASEFLWMLQTLPLGNWHPREIIKTAEATEQQRMSADSVSEWAQA